MDDAVFKWVSGLGTVGVLLVIIGFTFLKFIPLLQARYEAILSQAQALNVSQASEFHATLRSIVKENGDNMVRLTTGLEGLKTEIKSQTIVLSNAIDNAGKTALQRTHS